MAGAFLNLRVPTYAYAAALAAACLSGCLFDDPVRELDPALLDDASFDTLPASASYRVARGHILESFGAYSCPSCPEAEKRLSPYLYAEPGDPEYVPGLVIVNYHVLFSPASDPWVTPGTQARHDQFGFTSLPQVKLNGGNTPYGIQESSVPKDDYDSLLRRVPRVHRADSLTWLDLRVDTAVYDSVTDRMTIRVTVFNRAEAPRGGLSVRVLVVKNRSVVIPTLQSHPWEVIVTETTDRDSSGSSMSLAGMAGLRAKTWVTSVSLPPETTKSPPPPILENPADYAVIAFVRNTAGVVQNVTTRNFSPIP